MIDVRDHHLRSMRINRARQRHHLRKALAPFRKLEQLCTRALEILERPQPARPSAVRRIVVTVLPNLAEDSVDRIIGQVLCISGVLHVRPVEEGE